ncbi:MAG: GNAT family N-acetyltransferase [Pseudohongiella sp.]|nr:GNAT family N-acetyltransferase [Pseudohongiella sp.]
MSQNINVVEVSKNAIEGNMAARMMLTMFYAVEMAKALSWDTEKRYIHLLSCQTMIASGESRLMLAVDQAGMPHGISVDTKTTNQKIRRLDVLMVAEAFRDNGIGATLLGTVKKDHDIHGFATPVSVYWYEKQGFRNLGKSEDGTIEIFSGDYSPDYEFRIAAPVLQAHDRAAIEQLKAMEREMGIKS